MDFDKILHKSLNNFESILQKGELLLMLFFRWYIYLLLLHFFFNLIISFIIYLSVLVFVNN